jgi:signal peptidase I
LTSQTDSGRRRGTRYWLAKACEAVSWQVIRVREESMAPALPGGSWALFSRWSGGRPLRRFEIVRFDDPSRPGRWAVKRVIGLPGESVTLEQQGLKVNGVPVAEPHAWPQGPQTPYSWAPGPEEYVLLGDNRELSVDSGRYGVVPRRAIRGRVVRVVRRGRSG